MREKLLYRLRNRIIEEAEVEMDEDPDYIVVTSNIYHGDVGIWYKSRHRETVVEVINDEHPNRDYTNITEWLEDQLQRCDVLDELADRINEAYEDEWESHGFRDASDFWHWKEGR